MADLDQSVWTPLERTKYQNRALFVLLGEDMGEMGICVFIFIVYWSPTDDFSCVKLGQNSHFLLASTLKGTTYFC